MEQVMIVMGSDSDWPVMQKAAQTLQEFGVSFEVHVSSAHRTTKAALELAELADKRGIDVIIAGAGAAAHLPGVLAAMTCLPVIGVPLNATALLGQDALYAIVQMPSGVPVATVSIDGAKNAALLAVQILGVKNTALRQKFAQYKEQMASEVMTKDRKIKGLARDIIT